ncbi:hypothetical protein Tco_0940211, partial [Tanacetum coccineum]
MMRRSSNASLKDDIPPKENSMLHLVMSLMIKSVKSNGKSLHSDTSRLLKTNAPDVDDTAVGFRVLKLNGYQNFP